MKHNYIAEYPEATFAFIAKIAAQKEIDNWPSDDELRTNTLYQPTKEFELKMKKLIAKQKRSEKFRNSIPHIKRIILFFLIIVTTLSLTLSSVEAVQKAVISTVVEWGDKFVRFAFSSEKASTKTLPENINAEYWPEGYTDLNIDSQRDTVFVKRFKNIEDRFIYLKCEVSSNRIVYDLDNELSNHTKIIFADNSTCETAYWSVSENGANSFVFVKDAIIITIVAQEPLEEIIKIAKNINI